MVKTSDFDVDSALYNKEIISKNVFDSGLLEIFFRGESFTKSIKKPSKSPITPSK